MGRADEFRTKIENATDNLVERVNAWHKETMNEVLSLREALMKELDGLTQNEILEAIDKLGRRMDDFEKRLPPLEDEEI